MVVVANDMAAEMKRTVTSTAAVAKCNLGEVVRLFFLLIKAQQHRPLIFCDVLRAVQQDTTAMQKKKKIK